MKHDRKGYFQNLSPKNQLQQTSLQPACMYVNMLKSIGLTTKVIRATGMSTEKGSLTLRTRRLIWWAAEAADIISLFNTCYHNHVNIVIIIIVHFHIYRSNFDLLNIDLVYMYVCLDALRIFVLDKNLYMTKTSLVRLVTANVSQKIHSYKTFLLLKISEIRIFPWCPG